MSPPFKIAIVGGGGMVGAATAYSLVMKNVPAEVIMVDVVDAAAQGQALDIADAALNSPATCRKGSFADAGQADIAVITAGYPQKPGEHRDELLSKNKQILTSIINGMQPLREDLKLLLVANPVDVLASLAQQISKLPKNQVFGTGTYLDSSRLRNELSTMINVHPQAIDAYVLGEHGDRQFVAWSAARVGEQPLLEHPAMKGVNLAGIMETVARKAYTIIDAKRSTYFGIGMCTATIAEGLLFGTDLVFPLSHYVEKYETYMAWPAVATKNGVVQSLYPQLSEDENKRLESAVEAIKGMIKEAEAA